MVDASAQPAARCPRCGESNDCGFGDDEACWCATQFAPLHTTPKAPQDCYCRRCLAELLEDQRRSLGST